MPLYRAWLVEHRYAGVRLEDLRRELERTPLTAFALVDWESRWNAMERRLGWLRVG